MIKPNDFVIRWENCIIPGLRKSGKLNWQRSALVRYSPSIDTLPLPDTSRRFLIEAGLPSHVYQFQFGKPDNTLPTFLEAFPEWDFPFGYERYRILATEIVTSDGYKLELGFLCVDLNESGAVFRVSRDMEDDSIMYVNGSVEQLAEYLILMRDYDEWCHRRYPPLDMNIPEEATSYERYRIDLEYAVLEAQAKQLADLQNHDPHHQDRQAYADKIFEQLRNVDPDGIDGFWNETIIYMRDLEI